MQVGTAIHNRVHVVYPWVEARGKRIVTYRYTGETEIAMKEKDRQRRGEADEARWPPVPPFPSQLSSSGSLESLQSGTDRHRRKNLLAAKRLFIFFF